MNRSTFCGNSKASLLSVLRGRAQAAADVTGSESCPGISGAVRFYQTGEGVIVWAEIRGLPHSELPCQERIFGFHIHEGGDCGGNRDDPFANAMSHYNPGGCAHPSHAGDLPPLFGSGGRALCLFLTDRFHVEDVIGRTVVIHDHPDDLKTQPSGGSGVKIACGVIRSPAGPCL